MSSRQGDDAYSHSRTLNVTIFVSDNYVIRKWFLCLRERQHASTSSVALFSSFEILVPTGSPSRGRDVAVYVFDKLGWFMSLT